MDTRTENKTNKEGDTTIRKRVIIIMIMEGDKIGSRGRFPIKAEAEEGGIISRAGHSLADKVREGAGHRGTVTGAAEEDNKVIMMKETKGKMLQKKQQLACTFNIFAMKRGNFVPFFFLIADIFILESCSML